MVIDAALVVVDSGQCERWVVVIGSKMPITRFEG